MLSTTLGRSLFALSALVGLALMGCAGESSTEDAPAAAADAVTVQGTSEPAAANALQLLEDQTLPVAMTIASTRPGVTFWEYKVTTGGFVISGISDQVTVDGLPGLITNRVAFVLGSEDQQLKLQGIAWSNDSLSPEAVHAFIADAKRDYDTAAASVGGLPDIHHPYAWDSSTSSKLECAAGPAAGAILSAALGSALIYGGAAACTTGVGCIGGGVAILVGVAVLALDVTQTKSNIDVCLSR